MIVHLFKVGDIFLHHLAGPHVGIHGRSKKHWYPGCHDHSAKKVIRNTVGDLADNIGSGRRDYKKIGPAGERDMTDFRRGKEGENIGCHGIAGEGLKG